MGHCLGSASTDKYDHDMIMLLLRVGKYPGSGLVLCHVPINEYRELTVLPEEAPIRVQGKIAKVDGGTVTLNDAKLFFPQTSCIVEE